NPQPDFHFRLPLLQFARLFVVVVRRNSPTAKFVPICSRFLTLAASDPNLNPHHLADRPDRAPDMEALPGAVLCRGALRCHARPPGERSSNSFDRTVEASPPMRVTSPGHRPIFLLSPRSLLHRYARRCPKEATPNRLARDAPDNPQQLLKIPAIGLVSDVHGFGKDHLSSSLFNPFIITPVFYFPDFLNPVRSRRDPFYLLHFTEQLFRLGSQDQFEPALFDIVHGGCEITVGQSTDSGDE